MRSLRLAVRSLSARKGRALLVAATASVTAAATVALLGLVGGLRNLVAEALDHVGEDVVFVSSCGDPFGLGRGALRMHHVEVLGRMSPRPVGIAPAVAERVSYVGADGRSASALALGTVRGAVDFFNYGLSTGRFFTDAEAAAGAKVCVLEWLLAERLSPADPAACVGRVLPLRLGDDELRLRVVGVMEKPIVKEAGQLLGDPEIYHRLFVPLGLLVRGDAAVDLIVVKLAPGVGVADGERMIRSLLVAEGASPGGFRVFDNADEAELMRSTSLTLRVLAVGMAAACLLAEAVAVASILLVWLGERVREIGIRKAEGAASVDIVRQLLAEVLVLGCLGALVGIPLGVGAAAVFSRYVAHWPLVFRWYAFVLPAAASVGVAVFSGVIPSRRAAGLDPVAALRCV